MVGFRSIYSHSRHPIPADVEARRFDVSKRLVIALVVEVPDNGERSFVSFFVLTSESN